MLSTLATCSPSRTERLHGWMRSMRCLLVTESTFVYCVVPGKVSQSLDVYALEQLTLLRGRKPITLSCSLILGLESPWDKSWTPMQNFVYSMWLLREQGIASF